MVNLLIEFSSPVIFCWTSAFHLQNVKNCVNWKKMLSDILSCPRNCFKSFWEKGSEFSICRLDKKLNFEEMCEFRLL